MRYDEFVAEVRDRGQYLDQDQAERAVKAVLTVLGERLVGGEPKDLAGQLPGDLSEFLLKRADQEESYGVDGFIDRVAEELSGATAETARQDATRSEERRVGRARRARGWAGRWTRRRGW